MSNTQARFEGPEALVDLPRETVAGLLVRERQGQNLDAGMPIVVRTPCAPGLRGLWEGHCDACGPKGPWKFPTEGACISTRSCR